MSKSTVDLEIQIKSLESQIKSKKDEINNFVYESTEDEYDEFLDKGGSITICGCEYTPSQILKAIDQSNYNEGKNNFDDAKDLDDVEEYADLQNELEELEDELTDLTNLLEELESEEEE